MIDLRIITTFISDSFCNGKTPKRIFITVNINKQYNNISDLLQEYFLAAEACL